jgi:lipopolysaccharide/colanic/teichoic acid biosynthesis glycosyltransferase
VEATTVPAIALLTTRATPLSKRALDVILAICGLILGAPLIVLIAALIRLDSPGPVLFNRVRVGKDGRPFMMYKFRTMVVDAEARLAGLAERNQGGAHFVQIPRDPRVTRCGRWLRYASLDELPQLVNVLKGEMSLVGPRPQYPGEVALYTEEQRRRLAVLPGVTGLWQLANREGATFERWVAHDLAYIDRWTFGLDLRILAYTALRVVTAGHVRPHIAL